LKKLFFLFGWLKNWPLQKKFLIKFLIVESVRVAIEFQFLLEELECASIQTIKRGKDNKYSSTKIRNSRKTKIRKIILLISKKFQDSLVVSDIVSNLLDKHNSSCDMAQNECQIPLVSGTER
jgi:hypothetical protein